MPEFTYACRVEEIPDGGAHRVVVEGVPVAIVRSEGEIYAINDVCSHANVALSEGEIDGRTIECWLHGSRFDLASGRPTGLPATKPVPVYPVQLDDHDVYIGLTSTNTRPPSQSQAPATAQSVAPQSVSKES